MGGCAARWAQRNPEKVRGLLLLCPGFDMQARWPLFDHRLERWRRQGWLLVPLPSGGAVDSPPPSSTTWTGIPPSPWRRVRFGSSGRRDTVVPVELSHHYQELAPNVSLVETDDDHSLMGSLETILAELEELLRAVDGTA